MIRIRKPPNAPRILRDRGKRETEDNRDAFDASSPQYDDGTKTFNFSSSIYGAKSVKNALTKAQHDKCCFCESKISHVAYGDVEHFRPKAGFRQNDDDHLERPGYFWLAYDWDNLYFCCQICNQRHKKNLFPLQDPAQRARTHNDDIGLEQPLFVDPGLDDPGRHIGFREEYPYAIDDSGAGKTTISALGLDREQLAERRRDRLEMLKTLQIMAESNSPERAQAQEILDRAVKDEAEYAAMARALLLTA